MQVSIETTSGLERRMTVGIPAQQVDSEVQKRLQDAAKTIRINGFRQGKVPVKVVKQRYGAGVRQEVIGEKINETFYKAVEQENIKPAGQPAIEPTEMSEGKDVEFVATFEVYPEVELKETSGFAVTKLVAEVTDADVDTMIETLRKQQGTYEAVEKAAETDDQVVIDYVGTKDGEEFEGGKAEGQNLVLGSSSMIPGFEDGLVGAKAGEERVLNLTFPEDYHAEELKGAAVEFKVTVNTVNAMQLPEVNEEFYTKFGVEASDETEFRSEVKKNMERELKNAAKNKVKTSVMDQLLEANEVELPSALVQGEIQTLRQQMTQQFGGVSPDMDLSSILPDDMFKEQAERRVALGLIVGEVIKSADIQVDGEKVREAVEELASTYQTPEEVVNYYYSNEQMLAGVESVVLEDQVVDHLVSLANVTEQESTYEEVIKPAEQSA